MTKMDEAQHRRRCSEMARLMKDESLSEAEALKRVLPDDRNRSHKLKMWKRHGFWPVVEEPALSASHDAEGQTTGPESRNADDAVHKFWTKEEIIQDVIQAIFNQPHEMFKMQAMMEVRAEAEEVPPAPETIRGRTGEKGRKENREYERFTFGIDRVLAEQFRAEAQSRHLSAGKLLDVILWNRYGKPALSYMATGDTQEENTMDASHDAHDAGGEQ